MCFKKGLIFSVFLLLIPIIAETEVIDNRDSRREYARSVSQLGMPDYSVSSEPRLRKKGQSPITLVLFRSSEGIPEFGEYAPSTLVFGPHGCSTAAYADKEAAMETIEYLRSLPGIIYAELDGEVYANDSVIDSTDGKQEAIGLQHSFHSYGASEMGFEQAVTWCKETGMDSLTVAVIDSGVYPHPFLKDRLEISGFDYVDGDEDSTNDIFGHGTHVAGIVVDCTPELPVFICPIRILDSSGKGSIANTTSAIFEAAESGCAVINLSLTAKQHSEALEDAVKFALNHGTSVVIAAGNNGDDSKGYCPVHLEDDGLIVVGSCVGSINAPVRASYSNYGSCVDVFAFGTLIQSCALSEKYMTMTGTSQAAPHVSALCALLRGIFPSITCEEIESRVKTLSGSGSVNIPNVASLVPRTIGVRGEVIYLPVGTQIELLSTALPETSFIDISWRCDDARIATVNESNKLTCLEEGVTILRGEGSTNMRVSVELHVIASDSVCRLPSSLTSIEAEAFAGTAIKAVYLPTNIRNLERSVFAQNDLKTFFYSGSNMLFKDMSDLNSNICIVTDRHKDLWEGFENEGMNYLISCGE